MFREHNNKQLLEEFNETLKSHCSNSGCFSAVAVTLIKGMLHYDRKVVQTVSISPFENIIPFIRVHASD